MKLLFAIALAVSGQAYAAGFCTVTVLTPGVVAVIESPACSQESMCRKNTSACQTTISMPDALPVSSDPSRLYKAPKESPYVLSITYLNSTQTITWRGNFDKRGYFDASESIFGNSFD